MAAFLFFLSVALVLTNREDIQYTLFTDHKMRCNLAADGMLDYGLSAMRTTSDWESKFQGWSLPFNSGAEASVAYRIWNDPPTLPGAARYSTPVTASPSAGVELIATGKSGLFRSQRHLLLEEFRLADSVLRGGIKPHLFDVNNSKVSVLTPSLTWEEVGAPPNPPIPGTVSAGGGELAFLSEGTGAEPPKIEDFTRVQVGDIMMIGNATTAVETIPKGHGGSLLILKNNKWEWVQIPDPGLQMQTGFNGTITPDDGGSSATGWDALTLDWDMIAKTPSELTVDYSYFNGPKLNWYALTGTRAERVGDEYICHGLHYFYVGIKLKNSQSAGQVHSQSRDGNLLREPCLLSYNLKTEQWTVLLDWLQVSKDPMEEPTPLPGPKPNPSSLLVMPGPLIYTHAQDQSDNSWYLAGKKQLSLSSLPKRATLFALGTEVLYCDPRGDSDVTPVLTALNRNDIAAYFPKFLPERNTGGVYDPTGKTPGGFEPQLNLRWSIAENSLAGFNQDLFALARLVVTIAAPGQAPTSTQTTGLAHFDGKRWQILPAGLGRLLPTTSSYRMELDRDYAGGDGPATSLSRLVLGGYASDKPLLRRYVPVARWGDS